MNTKHSPAEIRKFLLAIGSPDDPDDPPIDADILETLVALNALGFNTGLSCAGHIWVDQMYPTDDGPNAGPYVEIGPLYHGQYEYEGICLHCELTSKADIAKREIQLADEISSMQHRMIDLLQDFYASRPVSEEVRLVISRPDRDIHAFTLASQGCWIRRHSAQDHHIFLQNAQAEMAAFTTFLNTKLQKAGVIEE